MRSIAEIITRYHILHVLLMDHLCIVKANYRSGAQKAISSIRTLTSLRRFVRITESDLETNFPKNAFDFAENVIIPILILIH